jgi:hypothetical protein
MAHPLTPKNMKQPILNVVNRRFSPILAAPDRSPQEFPLQALGKKFKADFAYTIKTEGWCFIEDDRQGTCLSSLLKYSACIDETNPERPIWVFQIIAPEGSAWIELCKRESNRLNNTIQGFTHVMITTPDWPEKDPKWVAELQRAMTKLQVSK